MNCFKTGKGAYNVTFAIKKEIKLLCCSKRSRLFDQ